MHTQLLNPLGAILVSVTAILIFGEILPQARARIVCMRACVRVSPAPTRDALIVKCSCVRCVCSGLGRSRSASHWL
jgi:hypothetical protein